jgi:hypothetical protein
MTRPAWTAALVAAALLAACGGGKSKQDTASVAAAPPAEATPVPGRPSAATSTTPGTPSTGTVDAKGCLHDGLWRACGLVDRLERSGLVVRPLPDTVRYEFLSVPGVAYTLGRGDVQAFSYDDTTRLSRDVAALDTVRVAPRGSSRHWDVPPTFVRSANLVAIVLSANEHLVERVQLALGAGAPQPEPPAPPQQLAPVTSKP